MEQSDQAELIPDERDTIVTRERRRRTRAAQADDQVLLPTTFVAVLDEVGEKPADDAGQIAKRQFAEKMSAGLARLLNHHLSAQHPKLFPSVQTGETPIGTANGNAKKIDVLFAPLRLGLALDVSIKTQNFVDRSKPYKRYTHNITRIIDQELHVEAKEVHDRFPHAVLAGIVLLPADAAFDANPLCADPDRRTDSHCSSLSEFAQRLREFSGRTRIKDPHEEGLFERMFVGVYWTEDDASIGRRRGDLLCFDTAKAPPRNGLPRELLTLPDLIDEIALTYKARNSNTRAWDDEPRDEVEQPTARGPSLAERARG